MKCMEELMNYSYEIIHVIGEYMKEIEEQQLKEIFQEHLPYLLQAYNEQVNFQEGENIQQVVSEYHIVSEFPKADRCRNGDIEIAFAYISYLKRLALVYAQVAVEVANPEFRSFLEKGFLKMNNYAYHVWKYAVKKEYRIDYIQNDERYA
ncbi:spore coat protein [Bacillus manliponensis]|uniref:Spore coat protein n=1 Tax=Bacillus manliponensis TaxID=574376 RepID=A0A073K0D4_9BACI|nr:spore coat protein [Bacillus manliponensis]KEK19991.1 spore coat protein [Bacillus manliponensis]